MRRGSRLLCIGIAACMMCGCGILPTEEEFDAAPLVKEYSDENVGKYTVTRGDMIQSESIAVRYEGTKKSDVYGTDDGIRIKKLCVSKGQHVKKGDVLLQEYLEDEEESLKTSKRQVSTLTLQISQAKQMRQRELEQLNHTGGSKEEKENVKTQYDAQIKNCRSSLELAKLDIQSLEETIREASLKAPISGTVTFVEKSLEGGYANQENLLVTIRAAKKNRFSCKTEYTSRFSQGSEVTVTVMGQQYKTTVKKGKGKQIYFVPKQELALKNAVTGTVDLVLKEKKNVLYVPSALVFDMGSKKVVYIEGKEGVKETREVTTGEQIQNEIEITGGLVMGLLILSLMGLSGCGRQESTANVPKLKDPVGVDVDTAKVKKMNLSSVNSYSGEVVPDMVGAYFANSGQAGAVKVEIGDKVKKGQLLATLTGSESTVKDLQKELKSQIAENAETNTSSQSKIEQLNIELKSVQKQKKQAQNAKDKKNLGKQIVQKQEEIKTERLRLKLQKQTQKQYIGELKSDIANAKKTSKLNRLYSPLNGEVIAKNLAPGDFVTGGVSVITIADMDKTQIRTEYIGSSVLDRASGYQAVINGKKYKVTAQEQDVSQMDVEMGNLPTSTYFGYEKDANVSVGDSVTLEFYNNATEDALVVPSNAVFKAKGEHYVDAKKKVKVTLGTKTDAYTQITSGLKEGDVVYVQD